MAVVADEMLEPVIDHSELDVTTTGDVASRIPQSPPYN